MHLKFYKYLKMWWACWLSCMILEPDVFIYRAELLKSVKPSYPLLISLDFYESTLNLSVCYCILGLVQFILRIVWLQKIIFHSYSLKHLRIGFRKWLGRHPPFCGPSSMVSSWTPCTKCLLCARTTNIISDITIVIRYFKFKNHTVCIIRQKGEDGYHPYI